MDLFSNYDQDGDLSVLLQDMYNADKFKGDPFKDWVDSLDNVKKTTLTAGEALSQYKTYLESVGKTTTVTAKAMSGLKKAGSILASMGTTAAIVSAISLALKALDDYTHQYTRALENASTAYLPRRYK